MIPLLSSFEAIVFDVDRTLLTLDQKFPEGLSEELHSLAHKGVRLDISTGRGLSQFLHQWQES